MLWHLWYNTSMWHPLAYHRYITFHCDISRCDLQPYNLLCVQWRMWYVVRNRPGKRCKLSPSGKSEQQCPQNCVIRDKGSPEIWVLNVGVAWWNSQIWIANPHSSAFRPIFWILNNPFFILLPQRTFLKINHPYSTLLPISLAKDTGYSTLIKMSASTACNFLKVWGKAHPNQISHLGRSKQKRM